MENMDDHCRCEMEITFSTWESGNTWGQSRCSRSCEPDVLQPCSSATWRPHRRLSPWQVNVAQSNERLCDGYADELRSHWHVWVRLLQAQCEAERRACIPFRGVCSFCSFPINTCAVESEQRNKTRRSPDALQRVSHFYSYNKNIS